MGEKVSPVANFNFIICRYKLALKISIKNSTENLRRHLRASEGARAENSNRWEFFNMQLFNFKTKRKTKIGNGGGLPL